MNTQNTKTNKNNNKKDGYGDGKSRRNGLSCYPDKCPPELESLVLVRVVRVDDLGVWGSLPDWGEQFKAYLPLGAVGRQRGKGERRAQAHFVTRARRFCAKGQPLYFVGNVQSVEQVSCPCTNSLDIESVNFHVTVSRRGVTDQEEVDTMELSREMHRFAELVVDKAADIAEVPREWARRVTLFNEYLRSRRRLDDGYDDDGEGPIPPEKAALHLLLDVIGKLRDTDVPVVLSLLELSDDSRPFARSLLTLCQQERSRRSKPVLQSFTVAIGGPREVIALAKGTKVPGSVAEFAAVSSALSSASTFNVPSGCGPVSVSVGGSGKYTFSTMAPPEQSSQALQCLHSVAARVREAWLDAATGGPADVPKKADQQKILEVAPASSPTKSMQPSLNIGVIGDVAHGKSTLVKAMSGKRTQAHSTEQQQHGITIRLGFANAAILQCQNEFCGAFSFLPESKDKPNARLPACGRCEGRTSVDGRVSFVDCPGHAELMATMLSGASTFDVVLFAAASNVQCPTPQARQHLLAIRMSGVLDGASNNVALIQTKSELVASSSQDALSSFTPSERLERHAAQGKKSLREHVGRNAPCFPVCAPLGVGLDSVAGWISERSKEQATENDNVDDAPPQLIVLRSFDINRPGRKVADMVGGVVGGTIVGSGRISVGDQLEIRPGLHIGSTGTGNQKKAGKKGKDVSNDPVPFTVLPLSCECTSLMSGRTELSSASKGGLVAVGTTLCPSFAADNGLVGSVVGPPGTLPPVWGPSLYLDRIEFVNVGEISPKDMLRKGSEVRCHVGSATVAGTIVRISTRRKKLQVLLRKPLCGSGRVALEAKTKSGGYLIAAQGRIFGGDCCVEGVDDEEEEVAGDGGRSDHGGSDLDSVQRKSDDESDDDNDAYDKDDLDGDDVSRFRFLEQLEALEDEEGKNQGPTRLSLPKPKLEREGKAHMVVENFGLLAASLRRDPRHLLRYLQSEGGLYCSLAGAVATAPATSLRVTWRGGRGFPERFGSILKKYMLAYVVCMQCRGAVTELRGLGASCELCCRKCNASRFVPKL